MEPANLTSLLESWFEPACGEQRPRHRHRVRRIRATSG
jgi:hypothetical protein